MGCLYISNIAVSVFCCNRFSGNIPNNNEGVGCYSFNINPDSITNKGWNDSNAFWGVFVFFNCRKKLPRLQLCFIN